MSGARRIALHTVAALILGAAGVGSAYAALGITVSPTAEITPTVTLNGDDQTAAWSETMTVGGQGATGFDITAYAAGSTGPNGTLGQLLVKTAPTVSCTGGSCTTGTPSGTVTYPVTLPTSAGSEIYSTASSAKGTQIVTVPFTQPIIASDYPGTYTTTIHVAVANGP